MDGPPPHTALVFAGGDPLDASAAERLPGEVLVVAADSGVEHALALGQQVDVVVGDLDSADPAVVERAIAAGAEVERHPVEKDRTDLELALIAARDRGARRIVVAGGHGGRLDHFLANALLLASAVVRDVDVEWVVNGARLVVIRARRELEGQPGDRCSLLAVGGPATGIRTRGLRYPLHGEELRPGSTRGVSNELVESVAEVTLEHGALLAVLPDMRGGP